MSDKRHVKQAVRDAANSGSVSEIVGETGAVADLVSQMADERDAGLGVSSALQERARRLAGKFGYRVAETIEVSELYQCSMATVVFRIEGRKRAIGENGEFEGLQIRVLDQDPHDDIPSSVFRRLAPGTLLLLPVGNLDKDTGVIDYGRFGRLADSPDGSVWMISAPRWIDGEFEKVRTKGKREFYPYHFARFE